MKRAQHNRSRNRSLDSLLRFLRNLLRRKQEPEDPHAYRMAPLRRPPHGRSGSAVAELDPEERNF